MGVEEAQHVMAGDHIQSYPHGPTMEVFATVHSPSESRLSVRFHTWLGPVERVLVHLPDDPVLVAIYSDSWDEETANAND